MRLTDADLQEVRVALDRLTEEQNKGQHPEYVEALAAKIREELGWILNQADDGTLPWQVPELKAKLDEVELGDRP